MPRARARRVCAMRGEWMLVVDKSHFEHRKLQYERQSKWDQTMALYGNGASHEIKKKNMVSWMEYYDVTQFSDSFLCFSFCGNRTQLHRVASNSNDKRKTEQRNEIIQNIFILFVFPQETNFLFITSYR